MKTIEELKREQRVILNQIGIDGGTAQVYFLDNKNPLMVVFSFGDGWDHVSVSYRKQLPNWSEMCFVKDAFFYDYETVVQFHPAKSDYVNIHPYVLHLWRKQDDSIKLPPRYMV